MKAVDYLREAIEGGCTRDDHNHIADYRAEVLREATPGIRTQAFREAADQIDNDDTCGCGGCDSCQPRRMAADLRARADQIEKGTDQ